MYIKLRLTEQGNTAKAKVGNTGVTVMTEIATSKHRETKQKQK